MTTTRKILRNNFVLNLSHVFSKSINFILILIITRMLGREGYGIYAFAFSFVTMFMVLGSLGINPLLTRDVAREKKLINTFLGRSIPLLLTLSGTVVVLIQIFVSFAHFQPLIATAIRIFSIYIFFDGLSRHFISVFRAFEKMEFEAITNLSERILMLGVSLILWLTGQSLILLISIFTVVEMIKSLMAFLFMRKFFEKIQWQWLDKTAFSILKKAFPFALMSIFATVSVRIDIIMLQYFHSESAVGLYNVAHKFIDSLLFIPENAAMALFPSLSVLLIQKNAEISQKLNKTILFFSLIAMPLSVGLFMLAPQIIQLFFEVEFLQSYVALRWLGVALGFIFFKMFFATILNSTGYQTKFAIVAGISMAVNIVLNYILIPRYQILGASLATIASEAIAVLLAGWFVIHHIKYKIRIAYLLKPILAAGLMGILLAALGNLSLLFSIPIAALFYLGAILLFRTIPIRQLWAEVAQLNKSR